MNAQKLLVVDGSNLLFQMFYGMPARIIGKHGKPIHGTLGFVGALLKMLRIVRPTHAVVLFDGACKNGRCDVDESYKANRPDYSEMPEEETPFSQLSDIFAALDELHIPFAETTECETDDWVAAYALRYGEENEVVIASFDSDFFQLINAHVSVLRYRGDQTQICDGEFLFKRFGIPPSLYAEFKCLVGDNADNVEGIKGIGPKTAAWLLNEFGSLDELLKNAEQIKRPSVRQAILDGVDRLEKNRRLIILKGDATLPYSLEALTYHSVNKTTGQVLTAIGVK